MVQQIARIIVLIAFVTFCCAVRHTNPGTPTDAIQENVRDDLMREIVVNSLAMVNYDFAAWPTNISSTFQPESDITFHLFTSNNPNESYVLRMNDTENLSASPFDFRKPTKIIIHAYSDSIDSWWVRDLREIYLRAYDCNVIAVDWSTANYQKFSVIARMSRQIGAYVGDFLGYLRSEGNLSYHHVHILGYSFGAHIAGCAGAVTSSEIGRITGLDPARPGIEVPVLKDPEDRLDVSDAKFVDVIHTCAGSMGIVRPAGHADFYPNGGSFRQPGCPVALSQYCSHGRAPRFMMESIVGETDFIAIRCDSWSNYTTGKCFDNAISVMGENVNPESRGKFFLETNSQSPFARGVRIFDDLASQMIA